LLRRYAQFAYRPTGHSLPEAWPPQPFGFAPPIGPVLALNAPPQPFAEAERKASPTAEA